MTRDGVVSCLMVTYGTAARRPRIQASLEAYVAQTVAAKELLIVTANRDPADLAALRDLVRSFGRGDITVVEAPDVQTLGALRNRSVEAATGEFQCTWDDDDLFHPDRLAEQRDAVHASGKPACYLQDVFQLLEPRRELYWTNWAMTPARAHPGSGFFHRSALPRYPETGDVANFGEDVEAILDLHARDAVYALTGKPHLFLYVTHGRNLWSSDHHRMLVDKLSVTSGRLKRQESQIRTGLAPFQLSDVTVMGSNGAAFRLDAAHED